MRRRTTLLIGVVVLVGAGVAAWTVLSHSPHEVRLVSRDKMSRFSEISIHKVRFPEFVTEVRNANPRWKVGFRDQTMTFTSPDGATTLWVSPGTYNPEPIWTDLGSSEEWTTVIHIRPLSFLDILRPQVRTGGTTVVDIPPRYWGKRDRNGFTLKLEQLPTWAAELYRSRTQGAARLP